MILSVQSGFATIVTPPRMSRMPSAMNPMTRGLNLEFNMNLPQKLLDIQRNCTNMVSSGWIVAN